MEVRGSLCDVARGYLGEASTRASLAVIWLDAQRQTAARTHLRERSRRREAVHGGQHGCADGSADALPITQADKWGATACARYVSMTMPMRSACPRPCAVRKAYASCAGADERRATNLAYVARGG